MIRSLMTFLLLLGSWAAPASAAETPEADEAADQDQAMADAMRIAREVVAVYGQNAEFNAAALEAGRALAAGASQEEAVEVFLRSAPPEALDLIDDLGGNPNEPGNFIVLVIILVIILILASTKTAR